MKRIPRGYGLPREDLVATIEELADRISEGDRSFDLQVLIQTISEALFELDHIEGFKLVNRISLMLITNDGKKPMRYEYVQKRVENMAPLDPISDGKALRSLASELRTD